MTKERQQYYLRAEPTLEGRLALRTHQERLANVFADLALHPRLTRADDLHWTTIFLGSPERWTRALRACGVDRTLLAGDLLALTVGNGGNQLPMIASANIGSSPVRQLPKIAHANFGSSTVRQLPKMAPANFGSSTVRGSSTARPTSYDIFFNGGTSAVFVLLLDESAAAPARMALGHLRERLLAWERSGRLPSGTTPKLFRQRAFPLARELNGGRPHITLARGRVSRERQRDVRRSIRATSLASREPISFRRVDVRIVRSPAIVRIHA